MNFYMKLRFCTKIKSHIFSLLKANDRKKTHTQKKNNKEIYLFVFLFELHTLRSIDRSHLMKTK